MSNQIFDDSFFMVLAVIASLIAIFVIYNTTNQYETALPTGYQFIYECDGEMLNDSCNQAYFAKDIFRIESCESGAKYYCRTIKEYRK